MLEELLAACFDVERDGAAKIAKNSKRKEDLNR
jgi:hypothetical protein